MVKHIGSHRTIGFFFANYKAASSKKIRSFIIPTSPQLLLLVKKFYKSNLIYKYTLDHFKNSIIIYPRFHVCFKNFQVKFHSHSTILSIPQLVTYQQSGYEFIIFSPFTTEKFITSTEFLYSKVPGYLLVLWLFLTFFKICRLKIVFFVQKRIFFHFKWINHFLKLFFIFILFHFFLRILKILLFLLN